MLSQSDTSQGVFIKVLISKLLKTLIVNLIEIQVNQYHSQGIEYQTSLFTRTLRPEVTIKEHQRISKDYK